MIAGYRAFLARCEGTRSAFPPIWLLSGSPGKPHQIYESGNTDYGMRIVIDTRFQSVLVAESAFLYHLSEKARSMSSVTYAFLDVCTEKCYARASCAVRSGEHARELVIVGCEECTTLCLS